MSASENPNVQTAQRDLDQDERLALAAVEAIQRLVAERNALREHAASQKQELLSFQRHTMLIRDSYRRLTLEFVTQLQHIDRVVSDVFPESMGTAGSNHITNEKQNRPGD